MAFDQSRLNRLIEQRNEIECALGSSSDFTSLLIRGKQVTRTSLIQQLGYLNNEIAKLEASAPQSGPSFNLARIMR